MNISLLDETQQAREIIGEVLSGKNVILHGPGGTGKCLHPLTQVLKYDGDIVRAQEIIVGDVLMGDDSTPRFVYEIGNGYEELFMIKLSSGESYTVNKSHVLSLKQYKNYLIKKKSSDWVVYYVEDDRIITQQFLNDNFGVYTYRAACSYAKIVLSKKVLSIVDISLEDYLKKDKLWKYFFRTYKASINFSVSEIEVLNGYFVGLWLSAAITRSKVSVNANQYTSGYIKKIPIRGINAVKLLSNFDLWEVLHIPKYILTTSIEWRLKMIAGVIDENAKFVDNVFIMKSEYFSFLEELKLLMRSVGLTAYTTPSSSLSEINHILTVYGNVNLPLKYNKHVTKKDNLKLSVMSVGNGYYCGFVLDYNCRFVLGNFIVTHNTHTIKKIASYLKFKGKEIACTATTGVAALGLAVPENFIISRTLHSWAGVGLAKGEVNGLVRKIKSNIDAMERWRIVSILILDEVSMLGREFFDKLEEVARKIKKSHLPFGGIQLILSGDFLQLPPVKDDWVFNSDSWKTLNLIPFIFKEPKRYDDIDYFHLLLRTREGSHTLQDVKKLKARTTAYKKLIEYLKTSNVTSIKPTIMYSKRSDVNSFNIIELEKLEGSSCIYKAYDQIKYKTQVSKDDNYAIMLDDHAPREITLKIGAQVMLKVNLNVNEGLVNGSRGVVLEMLPAAVYIRFINGVKIWIGIYEWILEDKDGKATRAQIPLILAWALTVHKSQGVTLDYAICDLGSSIFSAGQAYVALSRVRNIQGLFISSFNANSLDMIDKRALNYSKSLEDHKEKYNPISKQEWDMIFEKANNAKKSLINDNNILEKCKWDEWIITKLKEEGISDILKNIKDEGYVLGWEMSEECTRIYSAAIYLENLSIKSKTDWKTWLLKNHTDKGGDNIELCKCVITSGREMCW